MEDPTLLFFRSKPLEAKSNDFLISSMQSLESSFLLVALNRYPHAFLTCASAIESALQASNIGATKSDGLYKLLEKARYSSKAIAQLPEESLNDFRQLRNKITHNGFSPKDDSRSVSLYLEVALPLLQLIYQDFHSFNLLEGLLQEYVEFLEKAKEIHQSAKSIQLREISYCLNPFGHLIRWHLKQNFSTNWEIKTLIHAEEIGTDFEMKEKEKQELEKLFAASWLFDCPICNDVESVQCELDNLTLNAFTIVPLRMACITCGFVVNKSHHFLSEILLRDQVSKVDNQIFNEYGITKK